MNTRDDFSYLKARAAMHNNEAYRAGWSEIHEDGEPMSDEQRHLLMAMFRRVLGGPSDTEQELMCAISELSTAMGSPAVRAGRGTSIEAATVREAARRLRDGATQ